MIVRDDRIESVSTGNVDVPAGATVLDLKGRWLLPGFVDAHAHLADLSAARRALASGATTVRCLGVNHFVDIGFRELNHAGATDIPDTIERDPLSDVSAIQDVIIVVNNGRIAVNRLGW